MFNLIPIHPLDGFKVVVGLLPDDLSEEFAKLAQYGPPALMVIIGLPFFHRLQSARRHHGPDSQLAVGTIHGHRLMAGRPRTASASFLAPCVPRVAEDERVDAYSWLTHGQRELFESMMLRDQQHGILVYRRVRAVADANDRALFAAALLHDCGKGA